MTTVSLNSQCQKYYCMLLNVVNLGKQIQKHVKCAPTMRAWKLEHIYAHSLVLYLQPYAINTEPFTRWIAGYYRESSRSKL